MRSLASPQGLTKKYMRTPNTLRTTVAHAQHVRLSALITAVAASVLVSAPSFGDEQLAQATTAATQSSEGLQEITVTAQRYESTILDTPISISAMNGAQLQEAGITTVED